MLSELGSLEFGLIVAVVGLVVAVCLLALVFARLNESFKKLKAGLSEISAPPPAPVVALVPVAAPAPEPVPAPAPEPVVVPKAKSDLDLGDEIPDDLLPVLIAAAATAIGKPVRVKDVVLVHTEKPNVWGTQGRIVIQRSHDTGSHQW